MSPSVSCRGVDAIVADVAHEAGERAERVRLPLAVAGQAVAQGVGDRALELRGTVAVGELVHCGHGRAQALAGCVPRTLDSMTLQMAAHDPGYGAALAAQLGRVGGQPGTDSALLREYLRTGAGELGSTLRADRAIAQAAGEHARAWGGARMASRLPAAARAGAGDSIADGVLLATAVAVIQSPQA